MSGESLSPAEQIRIARLHEERTLSPAWRWQYTDAEAVAISKKVNAAESKRKRKAERRSFRASPSDAPTEDDK